MEITDDLRVYAAKMGVNASAALEIGMPAKAAEFKTKGGEVYNQA